jgi:XTP/dITP diphosphohydrolase
MILYCATSNRGKQREFRRAAAGTEWEIEPLPGLDEIAAPEETGTTFEENAMQKARYYARFAGEVPVFAEDSGIEVAALDGAPGVYSARFCGLDLSGAALDTANNQLLLERLKGAENRHARYVAVIALILPGQPPRAFRGTVDGEILTEPKGAGGFGYDPLFYYPAFGATFAEVTAEQKLTVSHRGRAAEKMLAFLAS